MLDGKYREQQGLPRGPGTPLTWGAQKVSEGSHHLSRHPENGMGSQEEEGGWSSRHRHQYARAGRGAADGASGCQVGSRKQGLSSGWDLLIS